MKKIPLTKGKVALVNDEDFPLLSQWKWFAVQRGRYFHAGRRVQGIDWRWQTVYMHRQIMGFPECVDHINDNGLDNRRENLRPCTRGQNQYRKRNGNPNRGIRQDPRTGKWRADIQVNGRKRFLGSFLTTSEASSAYWAATLHYFGAFARRKQDDRALNPV